MTLSCKRSAFVVVVVVAVAVVDINTPATATATTTFTTTTFCVYRGVRKAPPALYRNPMFFSIAMTCLRSAQASPLRLSSRKRNAGW